MGLLLAVTGISVLSAAEQRFDPVEKEIEGWTVHIDPAMLEGEHAEAGGKALKMLANHLQRIALLMPNEQRLQEMQKLEIWIEHEHPSLKAMQYHLGLLWLRSNGHDPRLVKKVHIPVARELLSRDQLLKHPAVVLHELAHAYHDQVLSFEHPKIIEAFKKSAKSGIYERVLLFNGHTTKP